MRALIVFESMFGDNEVVARAIEEGLSTRIGGVEVLEVGTAPTVIPDDVGLLLVGGPNHAAGMSKPGSRADAAKRAEGGLVSDGIGLREWFEELEGGRPEVAAVAWDTRMARPRFLRLFDRASRGIEKRLRKHGFQLAARAEHFYVEGATGPLAEGEAERARRWGEQLATELALAAATRPRES